ncbi:GNAT family N-acetyltransferase [Acidocella sp.]|jgi:ribosomal protein S18 acetylase RimI-like enzyme|uniref:GNAT family N-acetyltransferase n=1 Tax=Acidocella sp. TaxID=50710 RepID=UPI002F3F123B
MNISLRAVTPDDHELIYQLTEITLRPLIEAEAGTWDEAAQRAEVSARLDPATHHIIQINGEDGGLLILEEADDRLHLKALLMHPEIQGLGIAKSMLLQIQAEALARNQQIRLTAIKNSPAFAWYQRQGYVLTEMSGPYVVMA